MNLMYIDESGDTIPIDRGGSKYLVLTGCIIKDEVLPQAENDLRQLKGCYFENPGIEIKSNYVRYANPKLSQKSPLKLHSAKQYEQFNQALQVFLQELDTTLIAVVVDKTAFWEEKPAQSPYEYAYLYLLERYNLHLNQLDEFGICIIDPREGRTEKHYHLDEIGYLHDQIRHGNEPRSYQESVNVIEKLLFSQSEHTIGIQITDLYCYPTFHIFEYDKLGSEYMWFEEITKPKLRTRNSELLGYGLKFYPETNKNSLRFFSEGYF